MVLFKVFFRKLSNLQKSCKNNRMNTLAFHLGFSFANIIIFVLSLFLWYYHFSETV